MEALFYSQIEFKLFSSLHFSMLFMIFMFILIIMHYEEYLKKDKAKYFMYLLLILFISQQILLYAWYYFNDSFNYLDTLPLYPCRMLQILSIYAIFKHNERVYNILIILNIPSGITALILADTNYLAFPNAMFIQFFLGHGLMLIVPLTLKYRYNYQLEEKYQFSIIKIISIYFMAVLCINHFLQSNYGYLSSMPDALSAISFIPSFIYTFSYYLLFIIVSTSLFKFLKWNRLINIKLFLKKNIKNT